MVPVNNIRNIVTAKAAILKSHYMLSVSPPKVFFVRVIFAYRFNQSGRPVQKGNPVLSVCCDQWTECECN